MKKLISDIKIGERHRKEMGDLKALAASITETGLLQPVGITEDNTLVFGERRLRACRDILGLKEVEVRIVDLPSIVVAENAENEVRKDFTPSERVAIARAIAAELDERRGRPNKEKVQDFAQLPEGEAQAPEKGQKTTDFAAKKAGFGNRETFRQAEAVITKADPELVEAMDSGKVSIFAAHKALKEAPEKQREVARTGRTIADAERRNDQFRRSLVAGDHPDIKVQTIVDAVVDFAGCGMTPEEFRERAPSLTMAQFKRHMIPVYAFLKEFVEVGNDQTRAG